jgi:hypothetical protein
MLPRASHLSGCSWSSWTRSNNSDPASLPEPAFAEWRLIVEQVGMGAGADEVQLVTGDAVDQ